MPRGALRFKKTHGISRQALISIGTSLVLSWASAVSAMPPPAPGNQRGLQRRAAQPPVFFAGLVAGFGFPRSSANPELLEG